MLPEENAHIGIYAESTRQVKVDCPEEIGRINFELEMSQLKLDNTIDQLDAWQTRPEIA